MENKYIPNKPLGKKLTITAYIISGLVLILVGLMRRVKIDVGVDFSFLPPWHAGFNVIVAICLLLALYFIKRKNVEAHKRAIYGAMVFSFLFLLSYVLYHFTTPETLYCGEGVKRTVYFILLITHIVLAGLSLPFILITFVRGYTYQIPLHKKFARWVWPVWFYVAITGPICYWMLSPCYN